MKSPVLSCVLMRKIPLFRDLNETECRQLAEIMQTVTAAPGEVLYKQGDTSRILFVLLDGECQVTRRIADADGQVEEIVLATLESPQHFGEMSFFHPAPHSASVLAQTAVSLVRISWADYADLVEEGATAALKLAYNCVGTLAERLRRMDQWVAKLLTDNTDPPETKPEWSDFREKLFQGLNL